MNKIKCLMIVSSCALSACRNGGSSDGGVVVVPAPTPTPTPTPAPTPTPSPTPTPPPSYDVAFNFNQDFFFTPQKAEVTYITINGGPFTGNRAVLNEPPSNVLYDKSAGRFVSDTATFSDQSVTVNSALERRYVAPASDPRPQSFSYRIPALDYRYVAFGYYSAPVATQRAGAQSFTQALYRYQLIGVPTLVSDLPTTGTQAYPASYLCTMLAGEIPSESSEIAAVVTVNYATGTVTATLPNSARSCLNNGTVPRPSSLTFNGSLNKATNQVTGTISSTDSSFTGSFTGRLFGPGGIEAGFVFVVGNGADSNVAGQIIGRRG